MPASICATFAAAAAADVLVQRDAGGRWRGLERHHHLRRPARADAAAAPCAANITSAPIALVAASGARAAGRLLSAPADAAPTATVAAPSAELTAVAATAGNAAVAATSAIGATTAAWPSAVAAAAARACAAGRLLSAPAICAAVAAITAAGATVATGAATGRGAPVLRHRLSQGHRLRRSGRVRHQHDRQRRGAPRQVQPVGRCFGGRARLLRVRQDGGAASQLRQHIHVRDDGNGGRE